LVYGAIFFLKKRDDYQPGFHSPFWKPMTWIAILSQVYLVYGTFVAYPVGGLLSAAVLIGTGLPAYAYFRHQQARSKS